MSQKYDTTLIERISEDKWYEIFEQYCSFQDRTRMARAAKQCYFCFKA